MRKIFWGVFLLAVVLTITVFLTPSWTARKKVAVLPQTAAAAVYTIDDEPVTLGTATTLFGQPVSGDVDADGDIDQAVMLVDQPGGTGTFYYVAVAVKEEGGYRGTNAIFLGDRIAPQTLEVRDGVVIANYADRKPDEPFSADPSVGVSLYARLVDGKLVKVIGAQ